MCLWWLCCPGKHSGGKNAQTTESSSATDEPLVVVNKDDPQAQQDYEDLQYVARKRDIKVTIRQGTKAGLAAGLSVMAGTIVAGPVGALMGGAVGTAMAANMAKNVVPLNPLLAETPLHERRKVLALFNEAFKEERIDSSPERRQRDQIESMKRSLGRFIGRTTPAQDRRLEDWADSLLFVAPRMHSHQQLWRGPGCGASVDLANSFARCGA